MKADIEIRFYKPEFFTSRYEYVFHVSLGIIDAHYVKEQMIAIVLGYADPVEFK